MENISRTHLTDKYTRIVSIGIFGTKIKVFYNTKEGRKDLKYFLGSKSEQYKEIMKVWGKKPKIEYNEQINKQGTESESM